MESDFGFQTDLSIVLEPYACKLGEALTERAEMFVMRDFTGVVGCCCLDCSAY